MLIKFKYSKSIGQNSAKFMDHVIQSSLILYLSIQTHAPLGKIYGQRKHYGW